MTTHLRHIRPALAAVLAAAALLSGSPSRAQAPAQPNLSGYWGAAHPIPTDPARVATLPPNTVILADAGAAELPSGSFGGLKVKPTALAAALAWKPQDDMTISKACLPPGILYSMQGPFPMEIHQGTEFIIIKLEYFDLVRIIFMDGRPHPPAAAPHTKVGHSVGRWEGSTLVVDTTHLSESTITNNGLNHSDNLHLTERFWLSADGKMLQALQEFEDRDALENRGARFIGWDRVVGDFLYPYECDPSFGANYQK